MSRRVLFLFGLATGAWLNIWPAVWLWGSFYFAYALLAAALLVATVERWREDA